MEKQKTVLESEIGEQPEALARTLDSCGPAVEKLCAEIKRKDISYVMIAARGSSDNAGTYAKYLFSSFNGWPVVQSTPSLYTFYHTPPRLKNALVVGISQSGQSEDIVEVMADARRQGALSVSITADASSPLPGPRTTFSFCKAALRRRLPQQRPSRALCALLASLSATLHGDKSRVTAMKGLPQHAARTLETAAGAAAAKAERYRYMDRCVVIGRGFSYGIALEIALKLKELTYVTADPYSSADFLHGPMAMVGARAPGDPRGSQRNPAPAHEGVRFPACPQGGRGACHQRLPGDPQFRPHASSPAGRPPRMAGSDSGRDSRAAPGAPPGACQGL